MAEDDPSLEAAVVAVDYAWAVVAVEEEEEAPVAAAVHRLVVEED